MKIVRVADGDTILPLYIEIAVCGCVELTKQYVVSQISSCLWSWHIGFSFHETPRYGQRFFRTQEDM